MDTRRNSLKEEVQEESKSQPISTKKQERIQIEEACEQDILEQSVQEEVLVSNDDEEANSSEVNDEQVSPVELEPTMFEMESTEPEKPTSNSFLTRSLDSVVNTKTFFNNSTEEDRKKFENLKNKFAKLRAQSTEDVIGRPPEAEKKRYGTWMRFSGEAKTSTSAPQESTSLTVGQKRLGQKS